MLHVAVGLAGGGVQAVTAGALLGLVLVHVLHHGAGGEGRLVLVLGVGQV